MKLKRLFGKLPTAEHKKRYAQSPNWRDGAFQNTLETDVDVTLSDVPKMLYKAIFKRAGRQPVGPLSIAPFDKEAFLAPSIDTKYIWYGHSAVLLNINGTIIFIDPMMGQDASPIAPITTKRFSKNSLEVLDQLPPIDYVLMSHDHYDHLDLDSIDILAAKTKHFLVALGVGRHLESWGITSEKITEFDWWNEFVVGDLTITFTPSRHFSGRLGFDKSKSFWGGWVFESMQSKIYWSGDGGYGPHFKEVGEKFGPFDIGFMECGQYDLLWSRIHLHPDQTVQACIDAKVKNAVPVHWAAFALAQHHWKHPVEWFLEEGTEKGITMSFPEIGALHIPNDLIERHWWSEIP